MKTVTVLVENTEDRLRQEDWGIMIREMEHIVLDHFHHQHFAGGSPADATWQNFCFVVEVDEDKVKLLIDQLYEVKKKYEHGLIYYVVGETFYR